MRSSRTLCEIAFTGSARTSLSGSERSGRSDRQRRSAPAFTGLPWTLISRQGPAPCGLLDSARRGAISVRPKSFCRPHSMPPSHGPPEYDIAPSPRLTHDDTPSWMCSRVSPSPAISPGDHECIRGSIHHHTSLFNGLRG